MLAMDCMVGAGECIFDVSDHGIDPGEVVQLHVGGSTSDDDRIVPSIRLGDHIIVSQPTGDDDRQDIYMFQRPFGDLGFPLKSFYLH
jgi:hypothetical protein